MDKSVVLVAGEDIESEDEFDRPTALLNLRSQLVVTGEAPESDLDDFGSTVSLDSSSPEPVSGNGKGRRFTRNLPVDPKPITNLHPADKLRQRDPASYKRHIERNTSLRHHFLDKAIRPILVQNIKKLDGISQSLSNIQMATQEVLMQSRLVSENLHKMKSGLDSFHVLDKEI